MTGEQEEELGRLMVRAQDGDRQAYEQLLNRVAALAQAFVRRRLGDVTSVSYTHLTLPTILLV